MPTITATAEVDGLHLDGAATYTVLPPLVSAVSFSNFNASNNGLTLANGVTDGGGATYSMVPNSSTKAAYANGLTTPTPNPLTLLATGGNDGAHIYTGIDVKNMTIQGTTQGHLYNGLRVGYSTNARVRDVTINDIPGNSGAPPGETFSLNIWHATGILVERVHVEGGSKAASLFGLNNTVGVTINNCFGQHNIAGTSLTSWKCGDVHVTDFDARNCRRPFNIENPVGDHTYTRIDMRGAVDGPHITCNSQGSAIGIADSIKLKIVDPIVSNLPLRIGVISGAANTSTAYNGDFQTQLISDVQVIMNGVDVSADHSKVLIGNQWNLPV